ncbi:CASP-like protein 2B2 [Nymphaea colorata]|nr:CASP-like protein 2B2 [Nymphaea colorata]
MRSIDVVANAGNASACRPHALKVAEKRLKLTELVLRCVICGAGALVAVLVGTDTEVMEIFTLEKRAKFTDMRSLLFLVIANGMAASYCLVQGLRCAVCLFGESGSLLLSKPLAWIIFSCDQVMAYVLLSAAAAATQSAALAETGQHEFEWMKLCNLYRKFCTQVGEGIVGSYVVSLSMIALSCVSAFNLFRLYGGKGKSISVW